MRQIIAFIKPHKLSDVTLALHRLEGLPGMSVAEVRGFGRLDHPPEADLPEDVSDFGPTVRIEIFAPDQLVDPIVSTIEGNAHTGLRGDGKIYVLEIAQSVRISTGERGRGAT